MFKFDYRQFESEPRYLDDRASLLELPNVNDPEIARAIAFQSATGFSALSIPDRRWPRSATVLPLYLPPAAGFFEGTTCLAITTGSDYWLNIHDPTLTHQEPDGRCVGFTTDSCNHRNSVA